MWCVFSLSLYLLYPENFGTLFFHSSKALNVFSISPFCSCTGISVSMMSFSKTSNSCIFTRFHPWCHSLGWCWSSYPLWSLPPFLFLQLLWPWCLLVNCQSLYPRVRVCESLFFALYHRRKQYKSGTVSAWNFASEIVKKNILGTFEMIFVRFLGNPDHTQPTNPQ